MSDKFSQELIDKVHEVYTDKNVYKLMKTMTREDIISRGYRKKMIFLLVHAYCDRFDVEQSSQECSEVLAYLYVNVMNSIHLLFAEPIIALLGEEIPECDTGKELSGQLVEFGLELNDKFLKKRTNLYDIEAYRNSKGMN